MSRDDRLLILSHAVPAMISHSIGLRYTNAWSYHHECTDWIRAPLPWRSGIPCRTQSRASNIDLIARSVPEASHGVDIAFSSDEFWKGLIHVSFAEPAIFG